MRFQDKVVIVTGSSRGIGRATALRFAQEGAKVVVNYPHYNPEEGAKEKALAEEVVAKIKSNNGEAIAVKADVSKSGAVQALVQTTVDTFGTIDILINNAGICPFREFFDITEELWDLVQSVNLKGTFLCSQAVARVMIEQKVKGKIINLSSISSVVGGSHQAHYCASKAGINLLTKSLAIILGPHGITCNAILPGSTLTDMSRNNLSDPEKRSRFLKRNPLGRFAEPEDIASAIVMMASEDANYINGTLLLVDGGMLVNLQ